jgi:hypothetical protein
LFVGIVKMPDVLAPIPAMASIVLLLVFSVYNRFILRDDIDFCSSIDDEDVRETMSMGLAILATSHGLAASGGYALRGHGSKEGATI